MINIAIVEDDDADYNALLSNLDEFFQHASGRYSVVRYTCGENFLAQYKCGFDLIFMDIELFGINGMQTSEELRKIDPVVMIIFVTNMQQFAIKGYEVSAFDFIVKPIKPAAFALKLKKAVAAIDNRQSLKFDISVNHNNRVVRFSSEDLLYVEVKEHYLEYHTTAETYSTYGRMKEVEKQLAPKGFLRCNRCYLINPFFIRYVSNNEVIMANGDSLLISSTRKKEFMKALASFIVKGGGI